MLKDAEVKATLEQSFAPLECIVEIRPGDQIRFKVKSHTYSIYSELGLSLSSLRENAILTALIIKVRKHVEEKGYLLDPL